MTSANSAVDVAVGDWRNGAACRDVDPELFFPAAEGGRLLAQQEAAAREVCRRCPVLSDCRAWAMTSLPHGVAGGLTEDERRARRSGRLQPGALPVNATRTEVAAAGRVALCAGRSTAEVARDLGVSERTAQRWAAQIDQTADGSHGGNRAPVLISQTSTRTGIEMEGHRG